MKIDRFIISGICKKRIIMYEHIKKLIMRNVQKILWDENHFIKKRQQRRFKYIYI